MSFLSSEHGDNHKEIIDSLGVTDSNSGDLNDVSYDLTYFRTIPLRPEDYRRFHPELWLTPNNVTNSAESSPSPSDAHRRGRDRGRGGRGPRGGSGSGGSGTGVHPVAFNDLAVLQNELDLRRRRELHRYLFRNSPILASFIKKVILGKRVRGRQARGAVRAEATVDSATSSHSRGRRSYFRRT